MIKVVNNATFFVNNIHMKTLWQEIDMHKYKTLDKNIFCDILIIGGGITGINTLYELKDKDVILVEKNTIGCGITARSSAKITFLQENIYSKINDLNKAKMYYECNKEAINTLVNRINKEHISCDLEKVESYLYTKDIKNIDKIKKEQKILESFGESFSVSNILPNKMFVNYSIGVDNTYVFHPLKYINELTYKLKNKIYEHTNIIKIKSVNGIYNCYTNNNHIIKAKTVILACFYPYFLFPFLMPLKVSLEKSYITINNDKNKHFSAINIDNKLLSIRYFHDKLITVTNSHNLCFNKRIQNYSWSNHDIITPDYMPYIGYIKDNLIIATGYNTWGMTGSVIASLIIKDIINNQENKYINLFDPKRSKSILKYSYNMFSSMYSLIESKINKNKKYYNNNPIFIKDKAIYVDKFNVKHIVYSKCPHMRCNLLFNEEEQTWDCPCHGSRFTLDGDIIIGPANYSIRVKKSI